jgi:hypothetical protein
MGRPTVLGAMTALTAVMLGAQTPVRQPLPVPDLPGLLFQGMELVNGPDFYDEAFPGSPSVS